MSAEQLSEPNLERLADVLGKAEFNGQCQLKLRIRTPETQWRCGHARKPVSGLAKASLARDQENFGTCLNTIMCSFDFNRCPGYQCSHLSLLHITTKP